MAFSLRRPPSLRTRHDAYPYQLDAVRAVQERPYAALFHEQGLGKTKIGIDLILVWLSHDRVDTAFVVTKKSLVDNWVAELARHSHLTPRILAGSRRQNAIALNSPALVYVTNYETIAVNASLIGDFLLTCRVAVLLDESQKIKNPTSHLARHFHSLAPRFSRRIIMTGTPVANRPYDLWSQVKFLDGGVALGDSFQAFKATVDLPDGRSADTKRDYGHDLESIWPRLRPFSVRETKATAGIDLPEKSIVSHFVEMEGEQAEIYGKYRDQMSHLVTNGDLRVVDDAASLLKRLLRLVQCASNPALVDPGYRTHPGKYATLLSLCHAAQGDGAKVVIWTSFVENVNWLARELRAFGALPVHGAMTVVERNVSLHRFKTVEDYRLLVATPGSAKEGHTLTVANQAIFYDRSFSLDDYLQAQDRIHRITQTEPCVVHNLLARDTIDEWIDVLLGAKYNAAQLAQGDIQANAVDAKFADTLRRALEVVLSRDTD